MDVLFLLIPLSAVLVLLILAVFGWAVFHGQFEDLDGEGRRILESDGDPVDSGQGFSEGTPEESARFNARNRGVGE